MSPESDPGRRPPDRPSGTQLPERFRYKRMGAAYQGAMESVFAIAIATGAGWWVDKTWGTKPWGLLVGATIGFGAFVLRLYRLGKAMNESALADSAGEETSSQGPQD
jgi:ATP synthase protein I